MRVRLLILVLAFCLPACGGGENAGSASPSGPAIATPTFADAGRPYLERHCTECHGRQDPEAGLDLQHYVVPGGESYEMVARRTRDWLREAHGSMVVVTHGGVERVLRGLYGRLPIGEIGHLAEPQDVLFQLKDGQITRI